MLSPLCFFLLIRVSSGSFNPLNAVGTGRKRENYIKSSEVPVGYSPASTCDRDLLEGARTDVSLCFLKGQPASTTSVASWLQDGDPERTRPPKVFHLSPEVNSPFSAGSAV